MRWSERMALSSEKVFRRLDWHGALGRCSLVALRRRLFGGFAFVAQLLWKAAVHRIAPLAVHQRTSRQKLEFIESLAARANVATELA